MDTQERELSTNELMRMFDVTHMTVYNWRTFPRPGRPTIPFHTKPRGTRSGIFFKESEVLRWARETGLRTKNAETQALLDSLTSGTVVRKQLLA